MADQKIKTFMWFDDNAEEAAAHYVAAFKDSKITNIMRQAGKVLIVEFTLAGLAYVALNGGPMYKPTEAFSLAVTCDDQAEVDRLWDHFLQVGGKTQACGWLKDKYGFSWQIVPKRFFEMMSDKDSTKTARVMAAMMQMIKFDVAALEKAYAGE